MNITRIFCLPLQYCSFVAPFLIMSKEVIEARFTRQDIDKETNSEVRRVMMDIYGAERYVRD